MAVPKEKLFSKRKVSASQTSARQVISGPITRPSSSSSQRGRNPFFDDLPAGIKKPMDKQQADAQARHLKARKEFTEFHLSMQKVRELALAKRKLQTLHSKLAKPKIDPGPGAQVPPKDSECSEALKMKDETKLKDSEAPAENVSVRQELTISQPETEEFATQFGNKDVPNSTLKDELDQIIEVQKSPQLDTKTAKPVAGIHIGIQEVTTSLAQSPEAEAETSNPKPSKPENPGARTPIEETGSSAAVIDPVTPAPLLPSPLSAQPMGSFQCFDIRHKPKPETPPAQPLMALSLQAAPNKLIKIAPGKRREMRRNSEKRRFSLSPVKPRSSRFVYPVAKPKSRQERRLHYMLELVLGGIGLECYHPVLNRHGINYLDFLRLTPADLCSLGIKSQEDRDKLYECIQSLTSEAKPGTPVTVQSPSNPLRVRPAGTMSSAMQIQMLNNMYTHLHTLAGDLRGSKDAKNNILLDRTGREYTLGIANLRKQIQKPDKFYLDYGIQISDLLASADDVLDSVKDLEDEFVGLGAELQCLENGHKSSKLASASASSKGTSKPHRSFLDTLNQNLIKATLEFGYGIICCVGLLFM